AGSTRPLRLYRVAWHTLGGKMLELVAVLIPIVVAGVTTWLFDRLKEALAIVDEAPAMVKQALVAVVAFGLTKLSIMLGVTLTSADVTMLTEADLAGLLSAGLSYLFHNGKQAKLAREGR